MCWLGGVHELDRGDGCSGSVNKAARLAQRHQPPLAPQPPPRRTRAHKALRAKRGRVLTVFRGRSLFAPFSLRGREVRCVFTALPCGVRKFLRLSTASSGSWRRLAQPPLHLRFAGARVR
jgi:hypothetical protein